MIQIYYVTVTMVRSLSEGWLNFLLRFHMATVKVLTGATFLSKA